MSIPSVGRRDRTGARSLTTVAVIAVSLVVAACGSTAPSSATLVPAASPGSKTQGSDPTATLVPAASEGDSGTTGGDVPDNAVFLTYADPTHGFSIQYVEGWQVRSMADGVEIRDKDSSETIALISGPTDAAHYVRDVDLPALRARTGFALVKQDTVQVGTRELIHLDYHLPAAPDPVTGKEVPSMVDRFYVPGVGSLAIVTLSTPDGVDNVDAFRQMIESFTWAS